MALPPANSRYDKYDKADHDAAVVAAEKDPVLELFFKPPLTRLPMDVLKPPPEEKPPLLRQASVTPPSGPYKFTDKGPEKPEKGLLQPDTEYKRINLPLDADLHEYYSSVCQLKQVHHSSFGTDGVICAGEWIVRKGKLKKISANSGHYRPTLDALYRAVLHLSCARQPDSTIFLYDTKLKVWADVNWGDFIAKPSGGGRYSTHPDSPVPK